MSYSFKLLGRFDIIFVVIVASQVLIIMSSSTINAQLSRSFYASTCPLLVPIVRGGMRQAIRNNEPRMAASILRLFFHDCFVNGCDGSILLDDTATFTGEQNAFPNRNSVRGMEVIDDIKARVERVCSNTVSCADILALAAREGVVLLGGPSWVVPLGRRDSTTASQSDANRDLPGPRSDLATLISQFGNKNLSATDMTALSGAHTLGLSQCVNFRSRIYNETNIDSAFAATRQANCPFSGGDTNLAPFDGSQNSFDNNYFRQLVNKRGLLHSDQELFNGKSQDSLVFAYSRRPFAFFRDFASAMVKMGNLSPLTGTNGQIRKSCGVVNS
ncbi:peroxidase P7-like [Humulus lupulus]|uniref:peroxidase P7-like n=1 Tax=Humulus lupulus TaxID=3486 RepID=UPI002B40A994|nr:peroxidase P7-like [Humulus lupulus]